MRQLPLIQTNSKHRFNYGGEPRKKRAGRGVGPVSSKEPLQVVFKARKYMLQQKSFRSPQVFSLVQTIFRRYAKRFFVKVEEISIQHDHVHLIVQCSRRSFFHYFFRVVAGQIAQRLENEGLLRNVSDTPFRNSERGSNLWIYRPFTRVMRSFRAYRIAVSYVRLNEKKALKQIPYRKERLKGLSAGEWEILWS